MSNEELNQIYENIHKIGPQKCIFIHQHLGLGDHIVCNGITREIIEMENDASFFFMPVKFHNYGTLAKMYSDEPRMKLIPVNGDWNEIHNLPHLKISCKKYQIGINMTRSDWDVSFYDSLGVPFEKRWSSFKINRDYESEKKIENFVNPNGEPYILVHDTASWGKCPIEIREDIKIIRVTPITESITDWYGMVENAQEIHCIDSSFIHMCAAIRNDGTFHDFNKDSSWGAHFVLRDGWKTKRYNDLSGVAVPFTNN